MLRATLEGKNQQEYRGGILCVRPGANMKLTTILPLAIVLATTSAIGQDTVLRHNPQTTPSVLMQPHTFRADCPVGLQVQHGPSFPKEKR